MSGLRRSGVSGLLLGAVLVLTRTAQGAGLAGLYSVRADGQARELSWVTKSKWGWTTNGEGARVLKFTALITVPDSYASKGELTAESSTIEIKRKNNIYLITTGAMAGKMTFKMASGGVPLELRLSPPAQPIFEDKCRETGVALIHQGPKVPFFVGAACTSAQNKVKFHLTIPEEVSTGQSNLFESKGKGESWRIYDLGEITAATGELGRIELLYNDKTYNFSLNSLKKKSSDKPPESEQAAKSFSAGVGYASLSLQEAGQGQGGALYAALSALPRPLAYSMGLGGEVGVASPTASDGTPFSYLRISPYAFLRLVDSSSFIWDLKTYFVFLSLSQASSGIGVQASQPALGTSLKLMTSGKWAYQLEWMSESLLYSQIVQKQNLVTFEAFHQGEGAHWDYGGGLMAETLSATSQSGFTYQYNLAGGYFLLNF